MASRAEEATLELCLRSVLINWRGEQIASLLLFGSVFIRDVYSAATPLVSVDTIVYSLIDLDTFERPTQWPPSGVMVGKQASSPLSNGSMRCRLSPVGGQLPPLLRRYWCSAIS